MLRTFRWMFSSLLILFSVSPLLADEVLHLDPETTKVTFHLGATGHDVEGTLYLRDGEVRLMEGGTATGAIALDARKTGSGNEKRDKTMHKKVLESESYPWIMFRVQAFEGDLEGEGPLTLRGRVELLGVEHPVTLKAEVHRDGSGFEAHGSLPVPFVEWGLHDPSMLFLRVAKVVDVTVDAHGTWSHEEASPVQSAEASR